MGLHIKSRSIAMTRSIATLMMVFALVAQPVYGAFAISNAGAADSPLTVEATCVGEEVVLNATFTESVPGWQGGKIGYSSTYGATPTWAPQNLPAGDMDTWTQATGLTSKVAGDVSARVSGIVAVEKTGWFGIKYTAYEVYSNTFNVNLAQYSDINCDKTAPTAPVIAQLPQSHYNSPVTVSWAAATDNHSGIEHYEVTYRYANGTSVVSREYATSDTFVGNATTQGVVSVSVAAVDGNGNRGAESNAVQFTYDSLVPVVDINSLYAGQFIRGDNIPVRVTVEDANLEALSYRITNLGTNKNILNKSYPSSGGLKDSQVFTWETNKQGNPDYSDGSYDVYVSGRDVLQQRGEKRINVTVDNTKPTLIVRENQAIKPSGSYFKTSETVRIQPNDTNLGKLYVNEEEVPQHYASESFGINWYINQHPTKEKFSVIAEDKAGNRSDEYIIMVDRTAPTISINTGTGVNNGSLGTYPNFRQVSFKLYDKNGNLKEVRLNENVYKRGGQWNDLNWININKSHLKQGKNTITVHDLEGNGSSLEFNFDTVAPTANQFTFSNSSGKGNGNVVTQNDVTVTMNTSEPVQKPAGWTPVSDTEFTRTYESNGKYEVVLVDLAGNTSAAQKFEVKRIDKIKPVINIDKNAIFNTKDVVITVTEDNLDRVLVNGTDVTFTSSKPHKFTVSREGNYSVIAFDKAGNESSEVRFTIDRTGPEISIPKLDGRVLRGNVGDAKEMIVAFSNDTEASSRYDSIQIDNEGNWFYEVPGSFVSNVLYTYAIWTIDDIGNTTTLSTDVNGKPLSFIFKKDNGSGNSDNPPNGSATGVPSAGSKGALSPLAQFIPPSIASTTSLGAAPVFNSAAEFTQGDTTTGDVSNSSAVLGVQDDNPNSESERVLSSQSADQSDKQQNWWWLVLLVLGVLAAWRLLVALRRRIGDDE